MTTDTFLFNAGWLFFAAWIAVIAAVTIAAFGRDLLPWKPRPDPAHQSHSADPVRTTQSSAPLVLPWDTTAPRRTSALPGSVSSVA